MGDNHCEPGVRQGKVRTPREGIPLDEMRCTQCAAVSFSAAARPLVERGYRCPQCGGELVLAPQARASEEQAVGVMAESRGDAAESPDEAEQRESRERARRFETSE